MAFSSVAVVVNSLSLRWGWGDGRADQPVSS